MHQSQFKSRWVLVALLAAMPVAFNGDGAVAQDGVVVGQPDEAPGAPGDGAKPAQAKAAKPGKVPRSSRWIPVAGIGLVAVLGVVAALWFLNTRRRPNPPPRVRKGPPPLPADFLNEANAPVQSSMDPTAIIEKPATAFEFGPPETLLPFPGTPTGIESGIKEGMPNPPLPIPKSAPPSVSAPPPGGPLALLPLGPDSRGTSAICGRCGRPISAELGMTPWCTHCGADLKASPAADARPAAGAPSVAVPLKTMQPPYFVGRLGRTFRIYILPDRLLFLDAPAPEDESGAERVIRGLSIQGGLIGIMIGSAVAGGIASQRRSRSNDRRFTLDLADTEGLIEMANLERESFGIRLTDLGSVRIEALGFWQRAFSHRCAARLHFAHHERGEVVVDLVNPDDARVAIKQLRGVLGDSLVVNAVWDWGKERFVQPAMRQSPLLEARD